MVEALVKAVLNISIELHPRSSEGVGPDIDEKEEEEQGAASGDQAQSSHNSSDVWDIPGDPWATRGDGLVMFCPRNTK